MFFQYLVDVATTTFCRLENTVKKRGQKGVLTVFIYRLLRYIAMTILKYMKCSMVAGVILLYGLGIIVSCKTIIIPKDALISSVNQPITLKIPSNLGTGHQWILPDTSKFGILEHTSITNPDTSESTDLEIFKLMPKQKKGLYRITFYSMRPFDKNPDTANAKKIIKAIALK